jgi:hypothetical protein
MVPVPIPVSAFMAFQAAFSVTVHGFRRNCVFLTGYFIGAPIEITHFIGAPIKKHPPITLVSKNVRPRSHCGDSYFGPDSIGQK